MAVSTSFGWSGLRAQLVPAAAMLMAIALAGCYFPCARAQVFRVAVHGDSHILAFLAGLNSSEVARRFNVTSLNVTDFVLGPDPDSVDKMRSYFESVKSNPPDIIVGDFSATVAFLATELNIPYYCTSPSHSITVLGSIAYLSISSIFLMNSYAESMIAASQKLSIDIIQRQTIIVVADRINSNVNTLLNSLSNQELHIVLLSNSSNDAASRDALYNASLRVDIAEAVFQTVFTSEESLGAVLPEAASLSLMKNTTYWIVTDLFSNSTLLLKYRRTGSTIFTFAHPSAAVASIDALRLAMAEDAIGHCLKSRGSGSAFNLTASLSTRYNGVLGALQFDANNRRNKDCLLKIMSTSSSLNYLKEFGVWNKSSPGVGIKVTHGGLANTLPHVRVLAAMKEPFMISTATEYYGFCVSLLNELSSGLFSWEVVVVPDEASLLPMLRQGAGDLIANPMLMPADYRLDTNVTYSTWPVMYTGVSAMGYAEDRDLDFLTPLYPFSWNVWLAVIAVFFILSVTLYAIDKISPNDYKRPKFSISESIFFVYSSFMMTKLKSTAVKPSTRIFILILWFASLMYCTTYGTNSFFMLIRSNNGLTFDSLYGLYNQSSRYYTILVENSSAMQTLQSQPADSYYSKLAIADVSVESEATALTMVRNVSMLNNRRPVYVGDQAMIKYYAAKSCRLKIAGSEELHQPLHLALSAKLQADLAKTIGMKIQIMSDRGLLDQYQDAHWSEVKCSSNENLINVSDLRSVKIEQVAGIFIVLAGALVLSFIVLLLEQAVHQVQLQWQRSQADPGLEFGKPYRATVTSVTPQGLYMRVQDMREFLPNQMLSPDPSKKMSAADLQIHNMDIIEVVFLGNDPKTGERIFKRTG